jgi:hypothetical protein
MDRIERLNELKKEMQLLKREICILDILSRFDNLTILDFRLNEHNTFKRGKEYQSHSIELKKSSVHLLGRFKMTIKNDEFLNIGSPEVRFKIIDRYKTEFLKKTLTRI